LVLSVFVVELSGHRCSRATLWRVDRCRASSERAAHAYDGDLGNSDKLSIVSCYQSLRLHEGYMRLLWRGSKSASVLRATLERELHDDFIFMVLWFDGYMRGQA